MWYCRLFLLLDILTYPHVPDHPAPHDTQVLYLTILPLMIRCQCLLPLLVTVGVLY